MVPQVWCVKFLPCTNYCACVTAMYPHSLNAAFLLADIKKQWQHQRTSEPLGNITTDLSIFYTQPVSGFDIVLSDWNSGSKVPNTVRRCLATTPFQFACILYYIKIYYKGSLCWIKQARYWFQDSSRCVCSYTNNPAVACKGNPSHDKEEPQGICCTLQWVVISNTSRGPSCFSNSSWGNRQRHLNHEAHAGPHAPISWLTARSNSSWLADLDFHLLPIGCFRNHMTEYANYLYVAVEIPESWAAQALKGRKRARQ